MFDDTRRYDEIDWNGSVQGVIGAAEENGKILIWIFRMLVIQEYHFTLT